MSKSLGQIVYLFKDNRVSDAIRTNCHTQQMPQRAPKQAEMPVKPAWSPPPKSVFNAAMQVRTKEAREATGLTQDQMAVELGISQTVYSKYEARRSSLMPHALLARFCEITGITLNQLLRDPR
jgi:DNA-binding XRE family transcriptional regulator